MDFLYYCYITKTSKEPHKNNLPNQLFTMALIANFLTLYLVAGTFVPFLLEHFTFGSCTVAVLTLLLAKTYEKREEAIISRFKNRKQRDLNIWKFSHFIGSTLIYFVII